MVGLFAALTFLALAIQTTAARWLPLNALVPDFVLILAVELGLRHRRVLALLVAFAMGYALDAFSGSQVGVNTFVVTLVFLMAYEVGIHTTAPGTRAGAALAFVAVLIQNLGGFLISSQFSAPGQMTALLPGALLQASLTAITAPLVFALVQRLGRLLGLSQARHTRSYASRGV